MQQGSLEWFSLRQVQGSLDDDSIPRAILEAWIERSAVTRKAMGFSCDLDDVLEYIYFVRVEQDNVQSGGYVCIDDWLHLLPRMAAVVIAYVAYGAPLAPPGAQEGHDDMIPVGDGDHSPLRASGHHTIPVVDVLGHTSWGALHATQGYLYLDDLRRGADDVFLLPWEASEMADQRSVFQDADFGDQSEPSTDWCWYIPWRPDRLGSQAPPEIRRELARVSLEHAEQRLHWIQQCALRLYGHFQKDWGRILPEKTPDSESEEEQEVDDVKEKESANQDDGILWKWWDKCVAQPGMHPACPSGLMPVQEMHAQVVNMQVIALTHMLSAEHGVGAALYQVYQVIEQELWNWRMARYCMNEVAVYLLTSFNGFDNYELLRRPRPLPELPDTFGVQLLEQPLAEDQTHFMYSFVSLFQNPDAAIKHGLPDAFFSVPYEDAPCPSGQGASIPYPLHPGGRAHLSWVGVQEWLWQHQVRFFETTIMQWAYRHVEPYAKTDFDYDHDEHGKKQKYAMLDVDWKRFTQEFQDGRYQWMLRRAHSMARWWTDKLQVHSPLSHGSSNEHRPGASGHPGGDPKREIHIPLTTTSQQIIALLPPCMSRLMDGSFQDYPKFNQRGDLAKQLNAGKLTLQIADTLFVDMGRRYPDVEDFADKPTLQRKWYDWDWVWEKDTKKSRSCNAFIDKVSQRCDASVEMCCPIAETMQKDTPSEWTAMDKEQRHTACKTQCMRKFMERHGTYHRNKDVLYYPSQWLLWTLGRNPNIVNEIK